MSDGIEFVGIIFGMLIGFVVMIIYIGSVVWSYFDGEARGKSGCLVALLVALLSWPISLLVWIVLRPEKRRRL